MSYHINEVTFSSLISENLSTNIAITMFNPSVVTTTKNIMSYTVRAKRSLKFGSYASDGRISNPYIEF